MFLVLKPPLKFVEVDAHKYTHIYMNVIYLGMYAWPMGVYKF